MCKLRYLNTKIFKRKLIFYRAVNIIKKGNLKQQPSFKTKIIEKLFSANT